MIPTFETPRLILRPFSPEDADAVQRLAGDRSVADTTLTIPHPYEDGMAESWISSHEPEFAKGTGAAFAIISKDRSALVGAISLIRIEQGHQAELGYWIGTPYQNVGFCTEAGRTVLRYSFEDRGLVRIHARHLFRNPASGRVMMKLGMRHEGRLRKHVKKWNVLEDVDSYGILIEEWTEANESAHASARG